MVDWLCYDDVWCMFACGLAGKWFFVAFCGLPGDLCVAWFCGFVISCLLQLGVLFGLH